MSKFIGGGTSVPFPACSLALVDSCESEACRNLANLKRGLLCWSLASGARCPGPDPSPACTAPLLPSIPCSGAAGLGRPDKETEEAKACLFIGGRGSPGSMAKLRRRISTSLLRVRRRMAGSGIFNGQAGVVGISFL